MSGPATEIVAMRDFPVGRRFRSSRKRPGGSVVRSVHHGGGMTVLGLEDGTTVSLPSDFRVAVAPDPPRIN